MPESGEKPGKGKYQCTKCGEIVPLDDDGDTLEPCPNCDNKTYAAFNIRSKAEIVNVIKESGHSGIEPRQSELYARISIDIEEKLDSVRKSMDKASDSNKKLSYAIIALDIILAVLTVLGLYISLAKL